MFCTNCGNKIEEGNKFCDNCGNPVTNEEAISDTPVEQVQSTPETSPKKGNKALLITLISILGVGLLVGVFFLVKVLFLNTASEKAQKEYITGTTWYASDNSEMIFNEDRLYWYEKPEVHDDNYYSGKYKFYIGEEAVDYVTTKLSSYGVTRDELERIFDRSDIYDKSNFIVIDINYDEYMLNGKMQTITNPNAPFYGFILKDNTYLDVANMNTATYFKFTKQ